MARLLGEKARPSFLKDTLQSGENIENIQEVPGG